MYENNNLYRTCIAVSMNISLLGMGFFVNVEEGLELKLHYGLAHIILRKVVILSYNRYFKIIKYIKLLQSYCVCFLYIFLAITIAYRRL